MKQLLNQQQPLCGTGLKQSYFSSQSLSVLQLQLQSIKITHALQDTLAGLDVAVKEVVSNKRYTVGIIFLLIVAPLSSIFYQLCDPSVFVKSWYYGNNFYFLYTLSPYFMLLFASVGIFLLFPTKCKTSYLATVWPSGYAIAKLAFFSLFVHSNEQFHSAAPWFLLLGGVLSAIGFLMSMNYLLYRKYHLKHGTIARMMGIIKAPGIDAKTKMELLENQSLELENFNQRY
jgi:hypothetical protein